MGWREAERERILGRLASRPAPDWFDEAKFGVFIHWGLFSIPAFAPKVGSISDSLKAHYDRAMAMTPYTEWYANSIRVKDTPSARFHRKNFGGAPYEDFRAPFLAGLEDWDPKAWARIFRRAGARYVVLVSKHHDGFCLWPSRIANPKQEDWTSRRDIVGEIADAVRGEGLKFGLYYSGGLDWTFSRAPLRTLADLLAGAPGGAYPAYAEAQMRELIDRYRPSILWNDISWPANERRLFALFEDYYRAVPESLVNDRWTARSARSAALAKRPARRALDELIKARIAADPSAFEGVIPAPVPVSDFRTPEYARFSTIQAGKWEATRGMSHSFGFNRNDAEADYTSARTLLVDFVDAVAKNGNLLLNVGPRADGEIPQPQLDRLEAFGSWLEAKGEAIYATTPWIRAEAKSAAGEEVRFTRRGEAVNVIVLAAPRGESLVLRDVALEGRGRVLGSGAEVIAARQGEDSILRFSRPLNGEFAPAIRIETELDPGD
ncbi:MAG: alpha-L-fucosidase [Caulobacteraceae bacterium]